MCDLVLCSLLPYSKNLTRCHLQQATRLILTTVSDGSLELVKLPPHQHGRVMYPEWTLKQATPVTTSNEETSRGAAEQGNFNGVDMSMSTQSGDHVTTFVVMRTTAALTTASETRAR